MSVYEGVSNIHLDARMAVARLGVAPLRASIHRTHERAQWCIALPGYLAAQLRDAVAINDVAARQRPDAPPTGTVNEQRAPTACADRRCVGHGHDRILVASHDSLEVDRRCSHAVRKAGCRIDGMRPPPVKAFWGNVATRVCVPRGEVLQAFHKLLARTRGLLPRARSALARIWPRRNTLMDALVWRDGARRHRDADDRDVVIVIHPPPPPLCISLSTLCAERRRVGR